MKSICILILAPVFELNVLKQNEGKIMIIPHCAKFFDHSCSCNGHRMFLVAREPLDDGEAALNDDDVN